MNIRIRDYRGRWFYIATTALAKRVNEAAFVAFYDEAQVRSDSVITPLDWSVSTLLQAPIRQYAPLKDLAANSRNQWDACNSALKQLGRDVPLETDDADSKREAVQICLKALMQPTGIGPSIAAKVLHKKRPKLVPVVDDYVATVLDGPSKYQRSSHAIADIIFDRFKPQLLRNLDAIEDVQGRLECNRLSNARVLDIAIWMHADRHRDLYGLRQG